MLSSSLSNQRENAKLKMQPSDVFLSVENKHAMRDQHKHNI